MKQFLLLFFIIYSHAASAQNSTQKEIDLQHLLDEILGDSEDDVNYEDRYENFLQLLAHPININTASVEQLRMLPILTELQVQHFISYRKENGVLLADYELQAVPEFDSTTIQRLLPFITVIDPASLLDTNFLKRVFRNDNNYLLLRFEHGVENKEGFTETNPGQRFLGDANKYYLRFRSSIPNDFSIGITAEQDIGEKFKWSQNSKQYGVDFISLHAQVQNKGKLTNLIVGDYQLQAGQGLVLGGAFGGGKGGETINTIRKSTILAIPFTSASENYYLRGLVATYALTPNLSLTPFISHTYRDANTPTDSVAIDMVSSLLTTGLHRNRRELQDRKQLGETVAGGVLSYRHQRLDAGIVYQQIQYTKLLQREPSHYNQFAFRGHSNTNISGYLNYSYYNFSFFSEFARSMRAGSGFILGTIGSLSSQLDIALLYRHYQRNFYSFYANALSESSTPQNEKGFYWGLKYRFNRRYQLSAYLDFFEFPWLRYRSYSPSQGYEGLLRFQYQPTKTTVLAAQFRQEVKLRNTSSDLQLYQTAMGVKRTLFLTADYAFDRILHFKTRVQFSDFTFDSRSSRGLTILQDVIVDVGRFRASTRFAIFDTDDFDNRHYAAEKDVWLAYSLPVYFGKGVRQYVVAQYDFSKKFTVWLRYAHTRYLQQESIGTDLDAIAGNKKNDVKVQLRIKF